MTDLNHTDLDAQIALLQQAKAGTFNAPAKNAVLNQKYTDGEALAMQVLTGKAELYRFSRATITPLPEIGSAMTDEILFGKVSIALPCFPNGASAKEVADFIGDYRIQSDVIIDYQERTHRLTREGEGLNTKFRLATAEETAALIEADAAKAKKAADELAKLEEVTKAAKDAKKAKGKKNAK